MVLHHVSSVFTAKLKEEANCFKTDCTGVLPKNTSESAT
jgi:hypothetical protein